MEKYLLVMKWSYEYDKEGTWFDHYEGEEKYALEQGASYELPHMRNKKLEIGSVIAEEGEVKAELCVDHRTVTVSSIGEPVEAHADYSYSAAGDSVHTSLSMTLTIEKE